MMRLHLIAMMMVIQGMNLMSRWNWKLGHMWVGHMGDTTYPKSVNVFEDADELYKITIKGLTRDEHFHYLEKLDDAKKEWEDDE